MSGKKGKKTKLKTMPLQDFLGDTPVALPAMPKSKSSWADCMDDDDDYSYSSRNKEPVVLPTAPRAARDQSVNEENIPTNPPFVAYLSNLPYDVDEDDLYEFFEAMKISTMRLPKDNGKFKGYGYVEFEDRQSLIDALNMVDMTLKTRRIRIEVSNNSNDDRRGRMGRMGDQRRDYSDDPERTTGDWRSARAAAADDGGEREGREDGFRGGRGGFNREDGRGGFNREDGRDSGFEDTKPSNWRDAPRDSGAMDRPRPSFRESRLGDDRGGESRDWNRFADRGRGPPRDGSRERDGERGSSFGPRRHYGDDADRDKERWGSVRSGPRESNDDPPSSDASRSRPKLNLQPRSKPVEATAPIKGAEDGSTSEEAERPKAPTPVPAANIFGAAKPVDTAAREREIEERLAKSAEARKEEGDSDKRAPSAWGRRNGEGREDSDRSRPAWRRPENRDVRDQRDYRDSRDSRDSRDARDSRDSRDSRDYRESRDSRDHREPRNDSSGPPMSREGPTRDSTKRDNSRPPPDGEEREKKKEEDEISRMPKAKDDQAPNFVASNKYSMLPPDIDPDNIEE